MDAPTQCASRVGSTRSWRTVVLLVFALGFLLRLPTFFRPLLSDDEAIYATTADAMARGDLLYRDAVDHKPPLIYHVYQLGFAALGRYNTHGAHAMVVLSVLLTAAALLAVKCREGDRGGGLAAAAMFLVFSTTWHDYDALAANCELFVLASQAWSAWLLLRDSAAPARGLRGVGVHCAVGLLIGVSALFKYQGLTFLGVSVGAVAWCAWQGRMTWRRALVLSSAHLACALVPAALYLAWCVLRGNAAAAVYWFLFNFSYVGAGLSGSQALMRALWRTLLVGGAALVPYALGLLGAMSTLREVYRSRTSIDRAGGVPLSSVIGLLWLFTSAIAVCAGGRFFGHYFHLVLPPLGLLAAPGFLRLWHRGRGARGALVAACALPALFFFALASFARPLSAALDEGEPAYDEVAARMAALTSADERVFVWGNSPQLYLLARRPMGTRFSFCNYMTGESPGTPTETGERNADSNQLPAAWDMLFADLEERRPVLFVDAAAAGWDGYDKFPLARYPRLRSYVDQHYRPIETRTGVVLYRRVR
jgi:hypothetical protein